MAKLFWICVAGAGGTGARYLIGVWAGKAIGPDFPWGTLIVNVLGCFLIAAVTHVALTTTLISPSLRIVLTTGFMGGLTTYSSFNLETTAFVRSGAWQSAALNFGATVGGCFAAGLLGLVCARSLFGP